MLKQEKGAGNNSVIINGDGERVVTINKLLKYKCMTPTQHKKNLEKMNLT